MVYHNIDHLFSQPIKVIQSRGRMINKLIIKEKAALQHTSIMLLYNKDLDKCSFRIQYKQIHTCSLTRRLINNKYV